MLKKIFSEGSAVVKKHVKRNLSIVLAYMKHKYDKALLTCTQETLVFVLGVENGKENVGISFSGALPGFLP